MSNIVKIAPSIYTCDTTKIYQEIVDLEKAGIEWIHFDVMDGNFVNNFGLGTKNLEDIRKNFPNLKIDVHIMAKISNFDLMELFAKYADLITFNLDCLNFPISVIHDYFKSYNCKLGIALDLHNTIAQIESFIIDNKIDSVTIMTIKSGFAGQTFEESAWLKIKELTSLRDKKCTNLELSVDGGVRWNNIKRLVYYKINRIVVGSLMFGEKDYSLVMKKIFPD